MLLLNERLPRRAACVCLLLAGFSWLSLGCGGQDGPQRFHLKGKVDFEGKPVPAGMVFFDPDSADGNRGSQGFAPIVNGQFDTQKEGRGHVGGAMVVRITGLPSAPVARTNDDSPIPELFPEYRQPVKLDKKDGSRDFTVVKQAAPPQQGESTGH